MERRGRSSQPSKFLIDNTPNRNRDPILTQAYNIKMYVSFWNHHNTGHSIKSTKQQSCLEISKFNNYLLKALNAAWVASFIVVLKSFKEISGSISPLPLSHVHFTATFMDNSHDSWVRNCRFD
jgi:hypothetical protein